MLHGRCRHRSFPARAVEKTANLTFTARVQGWFDFPVPAQTGSKGLDWVPSGRRSMRRQRNLAFSLVLMCCLVAAGKDKKKILLPDDVLEARTVLVVVDPDAGVAIDAPTANRTAQ